jgi:hypothetical protein
LLARGPARLWLLWFALGAWWAGSAAAPVRAQDVAVDGFQPAPDQTGFLALPSTRTPGHLGLDTTLWLGYSLHTLETESFGKPAQPPGSSLPARDLVANRVDGTAIAQLGLWSRGAIALRMPVLLFQNGERFGTPALATAAAGNPALEGRVRVLGHPVRPDGSVRDGGALALRGVVSLPVGTSDSYFVDRGTRIDVSAIGDLEMFGIRVGAALGYRHAFEEKVVFGSSLTDALSLLAGLRVPLPLLARVWPGKLQESVVLELESSTNPRHFFAGPTTPVEARLAYRAAVGDYFVTLGGGAGLRTAIGSPDLRILAAFGWSPRKHDQDADGVPDSEDQCQHLPEDRDGFQDEDGCADDDNDGDLIVDEDDRCPLEAAEIGHDDDEDGCTDK